MQRIIIYLLVLIMLGAGVYFLVFRDKGNAFGDTEAAFNIKDTSDVGKIFLARTNGETITATRTDSGWVINNGQYEARESMLKSLMRTLKLQQPSYPVPEYMHNSVVKSMAGSSVKVELYNRKGEHITTFYVGSEALNFKGTFMIQEHAKTAYIVQIPGFNGYLTPVYSTDIDDWRDRTVIDLPADDIVSVSVKYMGEPLNSFTINQDSGKVAVTVEPGIAGSNPLNERRAKVYLKYFTEIYCEGFLNGMVGLDSTIASMPKFCTMDIVGKNNFHQYIEMFRAPLSKRSKNLATAKEGGYDIDRFYGVMNGGKDTALLQANTFEKLFRRGYEFYEPDAKQ